MERLQIDKLIAEGESETLEFKKSTASLREIGKTISAFSNSRGGTILVGVGPDGQVVGQVVEDGTQRKIAATIARVDPAVVVRMFFVPIDERREIIALGVDGPGADGPYSYDGRYYRRVGSSNSVMPTNLVRKLVVDGTHGVLRWETVLVDDHTLDDLDHDEILRTARGGIAHGRLPEAAIQESPGEILDRFDLRRDDRLLRAAIVLYGRDMGPGYIHCGIKLGLFKGMDKSEFLDQQQLEGNAFHLLNEAMLFCGRHLPVAGRVLPDQLRREDTPLYPRDALREAIVNALIHRDYALSGTVSVAIFDNRLEVWSPGTLPSGMRVQDLKIRHQSRPRNDSIAKTFYYAGLIENWGRGTQKIVELCVEAGHPEPEFGEIAGFFVTTFYASGYSPPTRIGLDLTEFQRGILAALSNAREPIGHSAIADEMGQPAASTLKAALKSLRDFGLIERIGAGRTTRYRLAQPPP